MSNQQPSLWDNIPLENGLRCLSDLEFEKALLHFREAGRTELDTQQIIPKALDACAYWQSRIRKPAQTEYTQEKIEHLLSDLTAYSFIPQLKGMKKKLLLHMTSPMINSTGLDEKVIETAFDLLLTEDLPGTAKELISASMKQHPENYRLRYRLAQAQWKNGEKIEANNNYVKALLYHPDRDRISRIENTRLKQLAEKHGPAAAPAYAWIQGLLPFVAIGENIKILDPQHEKALKGYRYLKQADSALVNKENTTPYRKQLKETDPDLFDAYFDLLQQRKATLRI